MIKYHLSYGMKILFVGINPHPGSAARGIPYSNNKMFWYLLSDAGLIDEPREILRDDKLLKKMYQHKFNQVYHFGIIGLINRPTISVSELKRGEELPGREKILNAIKRYKPKIVCFIGKITYQRFIGSKTSTYGWQPSIGSSKVYAMHTVHHGLAQVRINELKKYIKRLNKTNDTYFFKATIFFVQNSWRPVFPCSRPKPEFL